MIINEISTAVVLDSVVGNCGDEAGIGKATDKRVGEDRKLSRQSGDEREREAL